MAFPETMPRGRTPDADFIPFDAMTARQQAEHLVLAHGMGADYHGDPAALGLPSNATDSDLITWHAGLPRTMLLDIHDTDESYLAWDESDSFAATHTHTKEA